MPRIHEYPELTSVADADPLVVSDNSDGNATKYVTASNLATYTAAEHVATGDSHTIYAKIVNTDSEAGRTIYVGSIDPDVGYTPVEGDVWIGPTV